MAETLVIRMPAKADDEAIWIHSDMTGACIGEAASGDLKSAAQQAGGRRVTVLLPATDVLRLASNIPLKGQAKILQALPFALEETVAQDVDLLQFAIGERRSDNKLPVAVVERQALETLLDDARAAGLDVDQVYSEADAVPLAPNTTTVWVEDGIAIIRDDSGSISVDVDELDTLLDLRFPLEIEEGATAAHVLVYCDQELHERYDELWEQLRLRVESLDIKLLSDHGIAQLSNGVADHARSGVNLLQGRYAVKRQAFDFSPAWRLSASLFVTLCLLTLVYDGLALLQLNSQEAAIDQTAGELLAKKFPSAGETADPWGQLQSRLRATGGSTAGSGPGLIEGLNVLADALPKAKGLKVEALSFRNGIIDLRLEATDVAAIDSLSREIDNSGLFATDIQSANPSGDIIKGKVQLKAVNP